MFKLMIFLAVAILAASAAPAPVPEPVPPVLTHPLVYSQPYVKVLPLHPATLPLSYPHGYKLLHPGSVYLY